MRYTIVRVSLWHLKPQNVKNVCSFENLDRFTLKKLKGNVVPELWGNSAAPQFWCNVFHDFWETLARFSGKRFPKFVGNVTPESRVCLDNEIDAQHSRNNFNNNIIEY